MWSAGLVEKINNFQTLSLRDFPAANLDPFLSIHDDYFYHTPTPRRPEVAPCVQLCYLRVNRRGFLSVFFLCQGRDCAGQVLLCRAEQ